MSDLKVLQKTEALHEAQWWEPEASGKVHCYLCPRHCHIGRGQSGFCYIRTNQEGKSLYSLGYGAPAALQIDPIEKKPLNHFLPGERGVQHGNGRLQHGLFLLPELGYLEVAAGPGECARRAAGRSAAAGVAAWLRVAGFYLQRADHLGRIHH